MGTPADGVELGVGVEGIWIVQTDRARGELI
jgi:hypothetical protein